MPFLRDRRGRAVSSDSYLLFAAEFDGSVDHYLQRLCHSIEGPAHEIWGHCSRYPGRVDRPPGVVVGPSALRLSLLCHR